MPRKKYSPTKLLFDIKKAKSAWDGRTKVTVVIFFDGTGDADDVGYYNTSGLPKYFEFGQTTECCWEFDLTMLDQVKNDLTVAGFKRSKASDW